MTSNAYIEPPPTVVTDRDRSRLLSWLGASRAGDVFVPATVGDWHHLAQCAVYDHLAGLMMERADALGIAIPDPVRRLLERQASSVAMHNRRLQQALAPLIGHLNRADIPVVLLKGAALNLTAYAQPGLRPMSDLDLLVRVDDAEKAVEALCATGCRPGMELLREGFFPRYYYETELVGEGPNPARIDLHARPFRPLPCGRWMPDDALHEHSQTVDVNGAEVLIPDAEAMLIHLAAHAAYHGCSRVLWLYDLKRWVDHVGEGMDWSRLIELADQWRVILPVRFALERAASLLGPIAPAEVMSELCGRRVTWRDRLVLRQTPHDAASPWKQVAVNCLCTPGLRFRLGYLAALLRPSRSHLAGLYPYRHVGWVVCAHAWRGLRALKRLWPVSRVNTGIAGG